MPINRNSIQKGRNSETLKNFYSLDVSSEFEKESDKSMIRFIKMINQIFTETQLWGLTSIKRLVIQAEDNWKSDWYIIVVSRGNNYYFEYLIPKEKQPWAHAMVKGEANSLEEAKNFLLISMKECEGWKGNSELEKLLKENGIK